MVVDSSSLQVDKQPKSVHLVLTACSHVVLSLYSSLELDNSHSLTMAPQRMAFLI